MNNPHQHHDLFTNRNNFLFTGYYYITNSINTTIMKTTLKLTMVLAMLGFFAAALQAQQPAPFAGGVLLQQGGGSNQGNGIIMTSAGNTLTTNYTLSWTAPPGAGTKGILHFTGGTATTGGISYGSLDLTQDV